MTNPKVVVNTPRKGPKVFTVVLTATDLIWMGVGAALALTVFFVFGLLVGRGYFPAEGEYLAQGQMHQAEQAEQAETEVLKPEELTYPERISEKPKPKPKPQAVAPGNATAPAVQETGPAAETPGQEAAQEAVEATAPVDVEAPAVEATEQPETAAPDDSGEPSFNYIYQVAAFKERNMADDLAAKLKAKGLTSEVAQGESKGVTWYRVRVLHTGTPTSTRELRDAVFEVTQVKPMLVSKEPVQ